MQRIPLISHFGQPNVNNGTFFTILHIHDNGFFEEDFDMLEDSLDDFLEALSPTRKSLEQVSSQQVERSVNVVVVLVALSSPKKPVIYLTPVDSSIYGISCRIDSPDLYSRFMKATDSTSYNVVGHTYPTRSNKQNLNQ